DPVRAQRELAAGGWFDDDGDGRPENAAGEPFPVVDLLYNTNSSRHADIAIVLGGMWQRTLGVEVALRGKDSQYFKEDLKSGNFMVGRGSWYGDYGDPTTFLDIFRADNGNNDRGYSNPRIDAMLDDAADERDPATRLAKLAAVERVLFTDEVPMLTICQLVQLYMYDPTAVRGISRHPRLVQYLWELEHRAPEPTGPGPKPTDDHTQMN
ncbi:MAG: hypothetical protein KDA25_06275, partial [Phycisphaerales bacterium]|nr:hypothetical protein [Phycisphaerales bacterium]